MRLAAVYIPNNSLPHIFGENHDGQTLNFGGENLYDFEEINKVVVLKSVIKNSSFINGFWGGLSLVSCIVGKNGAGKTSILRAINSEIDPNHKNSVFIFEDNEKIKICNELKSDFRNSNVIENVEILDNKPIETLFYSPALDHDLMDTHSPISLSNRFKTDLEGYYLDAVLRYLFFLNDPISDELRKVYPDFPKIGSYTISVRKRKKTNFRSPYLEANFGNPHRGDALKNHLIGEISQLKSRPETFILTPQTILKQYEGFIKLLESESFTEQFDKLWNLKQYKLNDENGVINNSNDFINNLEITLLSYLLLDAVFPQTGLGGPYDFSKITRSKTFYNKLDRFLEFYLTNEDNALVGSIINKLKKIKIDDKEQIIELIKRDNYRSAPKGIEMKFVKERMINAVNKISAVKEFHEYIISIIEDKIFKYENDHFKINVNNENINQFQRFVSEYNKLQKTFKHSVISNIILDIVPTNIKLSTGEKAILDFYSSLHNYIINFDDDMIVNENLLLLLDEPELGYHPFWKKKFVKAISSTLPIFFSNLKKSKENNQSPSVQVIFTTHDPLTLSDLPSDKIIYLNKTNDFTVLEKDTIKSFSTNINELLSNSFYLENELIGDFAKEKIESIILKLNYFKLINEKKNLNNEDSKDKIDRVNTEIKEIKDKISFEINDSDIDKEINEKSIRKTIALIGEPVIQYKLLEMYEEVFKLNNEDKAQKIKNMMKELGVTKEDL
ncbi:AAA family ATPase [Flavobacterium adhaerens]|uniref:AAA family ATPase n=1 Tax=Flavobacterium adhaerens TaxID=3149043 RepID=UPI0032B5E569